MFKMSFDVTGPEFKIPSYVKDIMRTNGAKRYRVQIVPIYGPRTQKQNAYFHMLIGRIATACGGTIEYVKDYIKQYALTMGYPPALDDNGQEIFSSSGEFLPMPTHQANSKEMGILIDAALQIASEYGLEIEPGEQE